MARDEEETEDEAPESERGEGGGVDLMLALGKPEGGDEKKPAEGSSSYLDGQDPEKVQYLLDATDGDEAKAEALCRAIEIAMRVSSAPAESAPAAPEPPMPGGF